MPDAPATCPRVTGSCQWPPVHDVDPDRLGAILNNGRRQVLCGYRAVWRITGLDVAAASVSCERCLTPELRRIVNGPARARSLQVELL